MRAAPIGYDHDGRSRQLTGAPPDNPQRGVRDRIAAGDKSLAQPGGGELPPGLLLPRQVFRNIGLTLLQPAHLLHVLHLELGVCDLQPAL